MKLSTLIDALIVMLLISSPAAYAGKQTCTGKDPTSAVLVVDIDSDANTLTANNQEFSTIKPAPTETPGVIMVTKPFDTVEYGTVYITLANKKDAPDEFVISQVGVKDHEVKSTVDLSCKTAAASEPATNPIGEVM